MAPPFALSRLQSADCPTLSDLQFKTFTNQAIQDAYLGPDTPAGHARVAERLLHTSRTDPTDFWIKVVDTTAGNRMVAASDWKICPAVVPEPSEDEEFEWLAAEPERMEKARIKVRDAMENRRRLFKEPYVELRVCLTDPEYHRRGAGAMMLKWGCDLADRLFLPMWVEASLVGSYLYKAHGFEHFEHIKNERGETLIMRREARPSTFVGGKEAPSEEKADVPATIGPQA